MTELVFDHPSGCCAATSPFVGETYYSYLSSLSYKDSYLPRWQNAQSPHTQWELFCWGVGTALGGWHSTIN